MHGGQGFRDYDSGSFERRGGGFSGGGRGRGGFRSRGRGGGPRSQDGKYLKKSYSDEVKEAVGELYSKGFKFQDDEDKLWKLPPPDKFFKSELFEVPRLLEVKRQLNETKSKLNTKELLSWHKHTNFTNRAGLIIGALRRDFNPELCTQAWAKLHEILWKYKSIVPPEVTRFNSVHLCEAPGAFVASLNHFLRVHRTDCVWKWKAITLNPYFEENSLIALIDQDRFMSETLSHWYLGTDNSGDLTHWDNAVGFIDEVKSEMKEVNLVTADGSINCVDNPGEQEACVYQLLFCQALTAFSLLKEGGSFIMKSFTTLECPTICLLYLLVCCFAEVHVFKPATSKAGNSEQYLVCLGYKGRGIFKQKHLEALQEAFGPKSLKRSMFPLRIIPQNFMAQLTSCCKKFAKYQIDMIEDNLRLYDIMRFSEKQFITEVKELTCDTFKSRFKLKSLPRDKAVVAHIHLDGTQLTLMQPGQFDQVTRARSSESFIARMELQKKAWAEQVGVVSPEGEELQPPATKQPKLEKNEGSVEAVQTVLTALGFETTGKEKVGEVVTPVTVEVEPEDVQWLKSVSSKGLNHDQLKSQDGCKIAKVLNSRFCRHDTLKKLTEALENAQIMVADADERDDILPFITPRCSLQVELPSFFLTTDALHIAAIDHLTHCIGKSDDGQVLKFMDLVGAPSAFTHYIYWKKQHLAKGWGMVRVERRQLGPGRAMEGLAPWESFQVLGPHSGVDITDTNSIKSLCAGVDNYCPNGVDLVLGDSPPVPPEALAPGTAETLSKQHFLAQCICAFKILAKGGMFICRVYELLSRFSAGLVYLLYHFFDEVAIIKPALTSDLSSPERFLVCRGFQGCRSSVTELLLEVNRHMADLSYEDKQSVLEVLPVQLLFEEPFHRYLASSNERIARQRMRAITLMEKYFLNPQLQPSYSQQLICTGLLEILQLPHSPL